MKTVRVMQLINPEIDPDEIFSIRKEEEEMEVDPDEDDDDMETEVVEIKNRKDRSLMFTVSLVMSRVDHPLF